LRTRHRRGAAHVRQIVEFGLQIVELGTAGAGAGGITALRHEAIDYAVEDGAIVKTLARQRANALHMLGRHIRAHDDLDAAARRQIEHQDIFLVHLGDHAGDIGRRRHFRQLGRGLQILGIDALLLGQSRSGSQSEHSSNQQRQSHHWPFNPVSATLATTSAAMRGGTNLRMSPP
jgi:hypothetical protein